MRVTKKSDFCTDKAETAFPFIPKNSLKAFLCLSFTLFASNIHAANNHVPLRIASISPALPALSVEGEAKPSGQTWYRAYSEPNSYISKFTGDGSLLALTSRNNPVELWDTRERKPIATFSGGGSGQVEAFVDVSPNGQHIAIGVDERIEVRELSTSQMLFSVPAVSGGVASFSPDGTLFASAIDGKRLDIWNLAQKKRIHSFVGHTKKVSALAFSYQDQLLISGDESGSFTVWDLANQQMLYKFQEHKTGIETISFSSGSPLFVTVDKTGEAKLWDAKQKSLLHTLHVPISKRAGVKSSAVFSPDGKSVLMSLNTGSGKSTLFLFNTAEGDVINSREISGEAINDMVYYPSGNTLLLSHENKAVQIIDEPTLQVVDTFGGQLLKARYASVSPDGKTIAASTVDGYIQLWDANNKTLRYSLRGRNASIESVTFSANGKFLVTGDKNGQVSVWNRRENRRVFSIKAHKKGTALVAISPDGKFLVTASDKFSVLKLWDIQKNKLYHKFIGHHAEITSVLFGPKGDMVVSSSLDGSVKVWNPLTKSLAQTFFAPEKTRGFMSLAISPDGKYLASGLKTHVGEKNGIEVWDLDSKKLIKSLQGHEAPVSSISFDRSSKRLVSGANDGNIGVWDLATGNRTHDFTALNTLGIRLRNNVHSVEFTKSSEEVVVVTESGETTLWNLTKEKLANTLIGGPRGTWVSDDHINNRFLRGDDGSLIAQQHHDIPPAPLPPSGLANEDKLILTASRQAVRVGRNGGKFQLHVSNGGAKPSYWIQAAQLDRGEVPMTLVPSRLTKLDVGQEGILDLRIVPHSSMPYVKQKKLNLKLELVTKAGSHFPITIPVELFDVGSRNIREGRNRRH